MPTVLVSTFSLCIYFPINKFTNFNTKLNRAIIKMTHENSNLISQIRIPNYRLSIVSGHKTDLLEIIAADPKWHVMFVPGNPGVISFYSDFVDNLFELLGGTTSITAVGHISQTEKDWEQGKLYSLEDQINHKVDFIHQELQDNDVPIVLVGHSIGSYMALEVLRRCPQKVVYCIGLYPFLAVNKASSAQSFIKKIAMFPVLSALVASATGVLGMLPKKASRLLIRNSVGKSWSSVAVESLVSHLLKYHTIRNVLFLVMTEFQKRSWKTGIQTDTNIKWLGSKGWLIIAIKPSLDIISYELPETPDWEFMREKEGQIAFLFGTDDHWGPLDMHDEISRNVPGVELAVEREGHTHAFSCTKAGSLWAAQHVASLIKNCQKAKRLNVS